MGGVNAAAPNTMGSLNPMNPMGNMGTSPMNNSA